MVARVGSSTSGGPRGPAPGPMGVSAQLGEARARLRAVTPPAAWEAVQEEVWRVHARGAPTLLAAMAQVHDRVAAGWLP